MDTKDIAEFLPLLEGRTIGGYGDLVRQRDEARTLLGWYKEIIKLEGQNADSELEARIRAVIYNADRGISKFMAKPRLCTNAPQ